MYLNIIFIIDPRSSGKTTFCKALVHKSPDTYYHVEVDSVIKAYLRRREAHEEANRAYLRNIGLLKEASKGPPPPPYSSEQSIPSIQHQVQPNEVVDILKFYLRAPPYPETNKVILLDTFPHAAIAIDFFIPRICIPSAMVFIGMSALDDKARAYRDAGIKGTAKETFYQARLASRKEINAKGKWVQVQKMYPDVVDFTDLPNELVIVRTITMDSYEEDEDDFAERFPEDMVEQFEDVWAGIKLRWPQLHD